MTLINSSITQEPIDLVELINQPTWKTILLDLVKSEKMDPWQIDVSILADKYLEKINLLDYSNLRVPANAILCSAILLKHKSKALKVPSLEEFDEIEELQLTEEQIRERERLFLTEGIPHLIAPRLIRGGKVSLDDLVNSIEEILNKNKRKYFLEKNRRDLKFQIPLPEKKIDEKMSEVLMKLNSIADEENLVLFSRLVSELNSINLIHTFIALLFLHNSRKVFLFQEEFFGEIFISLNASP